MATKTTATVNLIGGGEVEVSIRTILRKAQFSISDKLVRVGSKIYDITPSLAQTLDMTGGRTINFHEAYRICRRRGYPKDGIIRKRDGSSQLVDLDTASITYEP